MLYDAQCCRNLVSDIPHNAIKELDSDDFLTRYKATKFLQSEDAEVWAELIGLNIKVVREKLTEKLNV